MDERRVRRSVRLASPALRLLACTWRREEVNSQGWRALAAAGRPFLLTAWHAHLLGPLWNHRGQGLCAMVSEHRDGEILARVMQGWGFRLVRGSSTRGAAQALLGLVRELEAGHGGAITPDGPRGPAGRVQPGVLMASARTRVPIVTVRTEASRAWRARSWDRFIVPKPFARVRLVYGDPWLAPGADEAAVAELEARLGPALPDPAEDP